MGGGPCDFSVSPSPFGLDFGTLDFGTLDFGTSDLGLTIFCAYEFVIISSSSYLLYCFSRQLRQITLYPGTDNWRQSSGLFKVSILDFSLVHCRCVFHQKGMLSS